MNSITQTGRPFALASIHTLKRRINPMESPTLKTALAELSRRGWRDLATADQDDSEAVGKILKDVLREIDKIEAGAGK